MMPPMASRAQNERKFKQWEEMSDYRRRYIREFAGRAGGRAPYIKEVDANETTVRFAGMRLLMPANSGA